MPTRSEIEHLLRRTEYVARGERVDELLALATIEDCVDNILDVPADPATVTFTSTEPWEQGKQFVRFWLDSMAHDSPRPLQEKMGFFWHGHFCSAADKVGSVELMREQIDLFRQSSLGNLRDLAITMSTQPAMLRYLDNNRNRRQSPNQNFARELMELFVLGVGNYTEADVEAATSAWTGHSEDPDTGTYRWRPDWHDSDPKTFLGRTINTGADGTAHGAETIEVMLGNGTVPLAATATANRGRPTRQVAAEFLTRKLWIEFAGTDIPAAVLSDVRDVAIAHDFELVPWLRALLTRPEFYTETVRRGLVRSPVEYVVACMVATGRRSSEVDVSWLFDRMGQVPLLPPNVSGWKHNGYWVSAAAMSARIDAARIFAWMSMRGFWEGDELIHLAHGTLSKTEIRDDFENRASDLVDRMLELAAVELSETSRAALVAAAETSPWWEHPELVGLIFVSPDFHTA